MPHDAADIAASLRRLVALLEAPDAADRIGTARNQLRLLAGRLDALAPHGVGFVARAVDDALAHDPALNLIIEDGDLFVILGGVLDFTPIPLVEDGKTQGAPARIIRAARAMGAVEYLRSKT